MKKPLCAMSLTILAATSAVAADPATIDWTKIPAVTVTLFYPGQSSYEWLRGREHKGAKAVDNGQACVRCHEGEEKAKGERIVKGGRLEPTPAR